MSRKTRKLIWSVPLVATLAIVGALAIFAALAPNGVSAHDPELPGSVTGLAATAETETSIRLNWTAPPIGGAAMGYRIDYADDDNRVWKFLAEVSLGDVTSYTDNEDVNHNTRRWYRVFAMNSVGIGPVSNNPVTAYVRVADDFPPQAPDPNGFILSVSADGTNALKLNWNKPIERGSRITGYRVVELTLTGTTRTECLSDPCHLNSSLGASATMDEDDGLNPGEQHFYRVYAVSTEGETPSNIAGGVTVSATHPDRPGSPIAVPLDGGTVELYWLVPGRNGGYPLNTNYEIQSRTRERERTGATAPWSTWPDWPTTWGDETEGDGNVASGSNAVLINAAAGLDANTQRQVKYQIRSLQDIGGDNRAPTPLMSGWEPFNNERAVMFPVVGPGADAVVPLMPTLMAEVPSPAARAEEKIILTWTDAAGSDNMVGTDDDKPSPTDYRIDVSDDGMNWKLGQRDMSNLVDWEDYEVRTTAGAIKPDRHYRIFPIAGSTYGQSDYHMATPEAAPQTTSASVLNLKADGISTTEIKLTWNSVPGATSYSLDVAMVGNDGKAVTGGTGAWAALTGATMLSASTTTHVHSGLSPGDSRWYRVTAAGVATGVSGSEALGMTKDTGTPGAPVGLVAEEAKDSSFFSIASRSPSRVGVLLLWDEPEEDDAFDPHTGYMVERSVNGGSWQQLDRSRTDLATHHHDQSNPQTDERRVYRVAALTGEGMGAWSNMAHAGHMDPATPADLAAMAASETQINLSWTAPNQGSGRVAYYQLERAYGDVMFLDAERTDNGAFMDAESWWDDLDCEGMVEAVMDDRAANMSNPFCKMYDNLADADETMVDEYFAKRYAIIEAPATAYMDAGLMTGTEYSYRLRSVHEVDGNDPDMHESLSDWSMTVMATPAAVSTARPAVGDASRLTGVGADSSTIELTWTAGDNADVHFVFGIQTPSYDFASLVWEAAAASDSHTVDMTGKPSGSYMFFVIAGQTDDAGDTTWSAWTRGTVEYP